MGKIGTSGTSHVRQFLINLILQCVANCDTLGTFSDVERMLTQRINLVYITTVCRDLGNAT